MTSGISHCLLVCRLPRHSHVVQAAKRLNGARAGCERRGRLGKSGHMGFVLWLIAVVVVIVGIVQLLQGQILLGLALIVLGFLVGPGGYSIFRRRPA